jgi:hypothetical protein
MTVASDKSMTSAPAGVVKPACTAMIFSSCTSIETRRCAVAVMPSRSVPAWITKSFAMPALAPRQRLVMIAARSM